MAEDDYCFKLAHWAAFNGFDHLADSLFYSEVNFQERHANDFSQAQLRLGMCSLILLVEHLDYRSGCRNLQDALKGFKQILRQFQLLENQLATAVLTYCKFDFFTIKRRLIIQVNQECDELANFTLPDDFSYTEFANDIASLFSNSQIVCHYKSAANSEVDAEQMLSVDQDKFTSSLLEGGANWEVPRASVSRMILLMGDYSLNSLRMTMFSFARNCEREYLPEPSMTKQKINDDPYAAILYQHYGMACDKDSVSDNESHDLDQAAYRTPRSANRKRHFTPSRPIYGRVTPRLRNEMESPSDQTRTRVFWTADETTTLVEGVRKHGAGNWIPILRDTEFADALKRKNNVQLKDKYRNLIKWGDPLLFDDVQIEGLCVKVVSP